MAASLDASLERRRWWIFVGVLLVVITGLRWPALTIGLTSDDYMHAGMIAGLYPGESYGAFDLYDFFRAGSLPAYVDKGVAPWWSEPELFGTVLRPLASLLLWLDHTLAPGHERLWLLHSLAWFLATIAAAGAVLRRLFPLPIAALALVLFACDASMIWPLSWVANRCVLVSALFGFAALAVHLDWRGMARDHLTPNPATPSPALRRWGPWIEGLLVGLALAGGEYALAIVGFVGGIELLGPGSRRERAQALLPTLIPLALYLLVHAGLDYGTLGTAAYVDPLETPLEWARSAASRVPALASSAFWSIPAATVHVFEFSGFDGLVEVLPRLSGPGYVRLHGLIAVIGVVLAGVALVLARAGLHVHERRALWMLGLGGAIGLLPLSVAPAHTRLLVLIQLGACPMIAAIAIASWRLVLQRQLEQPAKRVRGLALAPLAALALGLAGPGDLRWGHAQIDHLRELQTAEIAAFTVGDLLDQELDGRDVVVLNSNNQAVGLLGEFVLAAYGWPAPASWKPLAMGEFAMLALRPRANVLELSAIQGTWLRSPAELFFRRADQALVAGDVLEYSSLRVEVLADDDGHPTRVRFTFPDSLDHPRYLFLISTPKGLRRWQVPGVGQRAPVPLPRLPSEFDPGDSSIPPP
jgi:hypothetical protein